MRIEHIAIYVNDLEKARDFFAKYFGAVSNEGYHILKQILNPIFFRLEMAQE